MHCLELSVRWYWYAVPRNRSPNLGIWSLLQCLIRNILLDYFAIRINSPWSHPSHQSCYKQEYVLVLLWQRSVFQFCRSNLNHHRQRGFRNGFAFLRTIEELAASLFSKCRMKWIPRRFFWALCYIRWCHWSFWLLWYGKLYEKMLRFFFLMLSF